MKWSPAIAGKRGRCKCGATVQVPASIEPAAEAEREEDLLSALERPIRPVVEPDSYAIQTSSEYGSSSPYAPSSPYAAAVAAPTLAYARPASPQADPSDRTRELVREIYIPLGVLILGYVGMLAWLAHHGALVFAAVMGTVIVATLLMLGKTMVLGLVAWVMANKGGSFGHPVGTVLKIAGLVVSLDAAMVWAIEWMVWMNIIDHRGRFYIRSTLFMLFAVTLVVALIVSYVAYGLRDDEAKFFSRFMAGGNLTINVLLVIVLAVIGHNAAQQARATAAQTKQAGGVTGIANPATVVVITPADRALESYIINNAPYLLSPSAWQTSPNFRKEDLPITALLDQLEAAGASKVYVDTLVRRSGIVRVIVDLPTDPEHRDACCAAATSFQASNPQTVVHPAPPTTARYMRIDISR